MEGRGNVIANGRGKICALNKTVAPSCSSTIRLTFCQPAGLIPDIGRFTHFLSNSMHVRRPTRWLHVFLGGVFLIFGIYTATAADSVRIPRVTSPPRLGE